MSQRRSSCRMRVWLWSTAVSMGIGMPPAAAPATPLFIGLGDLPGGITGAGIRVALARDGSAAAGWSWSGSGEEAFVWTPSGGIVPLGDLAGASFASRGAAVTAGGEMVVPR
jgi:hypothetical protein